MMMERIPGRVLADCWSDLRWWQRFRISCTLRSYLAQLRRLSSHITGPPTQPGTASGALFDMETFGTFRSLDAFQYWCRIVALGGYLLFPDQHTDKPLPSFTDQELGDLVFTHGDLHQGNLILGDDGRLWVIDWDYAGFYPRSLETLSMRAYRDTEWTLSHVPWLAGCSESSLICLNSRWSFATDALVRHRWVLSVDRV